MITVEITNLLIIGTLTFLLGFVLGRYILPALQRYHDNWVEKQKQYKQKNQVWITGSLESRFIMVVEERLNSLYLKSNSISTHQLQDFVVWLRNYAKTQSYTEVTVDWEGNTESYTVKFWSAERIYDIKGTWAVKVTSDPVQVSLG